MVPKKATEFICILKDLDIQKLFVCKKLKVKILVLEYLFNVRAKIEILINFTFGKNREMSFLELWVLIFTPLFHINWIILS